MTRQPVGGRGAPEMSLRTPAFVGRARELAAVTGALARPPALVLVEGEAGIGKTRLVRECLAASSLRAGQVMVAVCPSLPEPFPLGPLVEALRGARLRVDEFELSPLAGALRPLFPEWGPVLPPAPEPLEDPRATRHRLFAALGELLDRVGVEVLVVEDAQWADSSTMDFLLLLAARSDQPASMVVTYRGGDVAEESPLWRLTARPPAGMACARVGLEPLTAAESGQLVASMFATDQVSEEFVALLHERTDGVPLALEESVRLLADRRDVRLREGRWTRRAVERLSVPPTVRDSVLERISRLDPGTRAVLEAAAVLADPADESLLASVAGLADDAARAGVAAGLGSGLLEEVTAGFFRFRHVLAAQAVYEAIPVSERRRRHLRAASALETTQPPPVAQLTRHFGEAGEVEAWCGYAESAADTAAASGDSQAAVALLLDVLGRGRHPVDRRVRLARKLGQAAVYGRGAVGGQGDQVVAALRAALAHSDLPAAERGEVRRLLAGVLSELGEMHAAWEQTEAALPDLADRPQEAARAMLVLARPLTPAGTAAEHLAWLERATELLGQRACFRSVIPVVLRRPARSS